MQHRQERQCRDHPVAPVLHRGRVRAVQDVHEDQDVAGDSDQAGVGETPADPAAVGGTEPSQICVVMPLSRISVGGDLTYN